MQRKDPRQQYSKRLEESEDTKRGTSKKARYKKDTSGVETGVKGDRERVRACKGSMKALQRMIGTKNSLHCLET